MVVAARSCCCNPAEDTLAKNETEPAYVPVTHPALLTIDYACFAFFIVEIFLRFFACPNRLEFIRAPLNVIDGVCLLPHLIAIILKAFSRYKTAAIIKVYYPVMMRATHTPHTRTHAHICTHILKCLSKCLLIYIAPYL